MKLWLLIPVKPFIDSKSRMSPILDGEERARLSRQLLEDILHLAQSSNLFAEILVISRDAAVLEVAQSLGARILVETGAHPPALVTGETIASSPWLGTGNLPPDPEAPLNLALGAGQAEALRGGADAVLVLPADLPLLTLDDLRALVEPAARANVAAGSAVVLAPSHDGGTNALLMRPPAAIPFAFGSQSFARHQSLAQNAGCTVTVIRTPSLLYDLDLPEDLWGEELGI